MMPSTILAAIIFCFHFGLSSALYENVSYQDIILKVLQLQHGGFEQFENVDINQIQTLFLDPMPYLNDSKALTPWEILHNGASQEATQVNDSCRSDVEETIRAAMKRENWALRSEYGFS